MNQESHRIISKKRLFSLLNVCSGYFTCSLDTKSKRTALCLSILSRFQEWDSVSGRWFKSTFTVCQRFYSSRVFFCQHQEMLRCVGKYTVSYGWGTIQSLLNSIRFQWTYTSMGIACSRFTSMWWTQNLWRAISQIWYYLVGVTNSETQKSEECAFQILSGHRYFLIEFLNISDSSTSHIT